MSLSEFWVRLHKAIDILADHYGLSDQLGSYVKNLRLCYQGKVTGGYPDFSTIERITWATDTAATSTRGPLSRGRDGPSAAGGIQ